MEKFLRFSIVEYAFLFSSFPNKLQAYHYIDHILLDQCRPRSLFSPKTISPES